MREESERTSALHRRAYLAGVAGASATAGCQGWSDLPAQARGDDDGNGGSDFVWLSGSLLSDEPVRRNLLAFAARRDLAAILAIPDPKASGAIDSLRDGLVTAERFGVPAWLHAGVLTDVTADEFAGSRDARERNLRGIRRAAETYSEFESGGKFIPWQEAPVMGGWSDRKWDDEAVDNLRTYGPAVFAAQRRTAREVDPEIDVGVFVHFPYVVDSKQPAVFARLLDDLHRQGTPPDFAFADYYRGWYEKDVGPEPANDAVRSLVSNAKDGLRGGDVYYMGQAHTINPGHTPSRQSLRMDHRAALDAGADGVGWYARTAYVPTEQGFDPLVPNPEGSDAADRPRASTFTVARDRYRYAWAATADARAATGDVGAGMGDAGTAAARGRDADRFDLWLRVPDAGFYDHRIRLRSGSDDGEGRFVGDVGTHLDAAAPYADVGAETIRSLDRERYLDDGQLEIEIETDADADATRLVEAAAVPCDPGAYLTDADVAAAMASGEHAAAALGRERVDSRLAPGETLRLSIPTDADAETPVGALLGERRTALRRRLADAEAEAKGDSSEFVAPDERFDLWVLGDGLPDVDTIGAELRVGDLSGPGDTAHAAAESPVAALFCGIDRDRLFEDGAVVGWTGRGGDERPDWIGGVETAVAMPYFGSGNVVTPARAAELFDRQPEEVRTYALAVASAP